MEGQQAGSVSGHKDLETELTEMLEGMDLPEMSGVHEQCIYTILPHVRQANPEAYTPKVVSIGPFHKPRASGVDDHFLVQMEELKLKYLKGFLTRTNLDVRHFVLKLQEWENSIRRCYAGPVHYNSNDFLKMILIDSCFIIELFLRYYEYTKWKDTDPILLNSLLASEIERDMILLENQLPFFLLENIFNLAFETPSFLKITFAYLRHLNKQNINPEGVCPKHFTHLVRIFVLSTSFDHETTVGGEDAFNHLYSASQLSEAGLVFDVNQQSKCLLDVEFHEGVLTMPCIVIDDTTETFLRNIIAFEEFHLPWKERYISQYVSILEFLIKTAKDVNLLVDKKIIVNWIGDANAIATMFNNLGKNIHMPRLNSKCLTLCQSLNGFYENPRNKYKAVFIHEYFNTPWKIASTIAAVSLLLLTLIQTICSIISTIQG